MARPRGKKVATRLSIGLDAKTYAAVSTLAARNDVPVSWIVRRAVTEFVERQTANAEGVALWRRTLALVKELQNTTPPDGLSHPLKNTPPERPQTVQ